MNLIQTIQNYSTTLWGQHNTSVINDIFSKDVIIHSPLKTVKGREKMHEIVNAWLQAFPDLSVTWDEFIETNDKVVSVWHASGTHQYEFMDIPATGRQIQYKGLTVYGFSDNRITEYWAIVDMDEIKQQLS